MHCRRLVSFKGSRTTYAIGVKVSNPFAADQGKPCFFTLSWRFRAVMSTAKAWHQGFKAIAEHDRGGGKTRVDKGRCS
jgi:hypothetical protein